MAYPFQLPDLGYAYDALEPHIDARTMEIHHSKHHAGYTSKFNAALEGHADLHGKSAIEIISDLDALPDAIRTAVRNNGGGFVNHRLEASLVIQAPQRIIFRCEHVIRQRHFSPFSALPAEMNVAGHGLKYFLSFLRCLCLSRLVD